eukprot:jgi/Botrbrau1/12012/Bobra.247_2s0017.1
MDCLETLWIVWILISSYVTEHRKIPWAGIRHVQNQTLVRTAGALVFSSLGSGA